MRLWYQGEGRIATDRTGQRNRRSLECHRTCTQQPFWCTEAHAGDALPVQGERNAQGEWEMSISLATEYGFRGVTYLAMVDRDRPVTIDEICEAQRVPKNYLIKIFKTLSSAGLIRSHKGFRGGFSLARPAEQISMHEVFAVLAGAFVLQSDAGCLFGAERCPRDEGQFCCRQVVGNVNRRMQDMLRAVTLRDAAEQRIAQREQPTDRRSRRK